MSDIVSARERVELVFDEELHGRVWESLDLRQHGSMSLGLDDVGSWYRMFCSFELWCIRASDRLSESSSEEELDMPLRIPIGLFLLN